MKYKYQNAKANISMNVSLEYGASNYWSGFPLLNCVYSLNGIYCDYIMRIISKAVERRRHKAKRACTVWMAASCTKCLALRNRRAVFLYHYGVSTVDYISIAQAAEKWGITVRRVQVLCAQNRIPGLTKFGKAWAIPKDAKKPVDARKIKLVK